MIEDDVLSLALANGKTDLCPLGIKNLDDLLGGGVPCGSTILVEGPPGSGKTSFAAKFIYEGALRGEKGVYVSFVEGKYSFYSFMKSLGMDFYELEKKGLVSFIEAIPLHNEEAARLIIERVLMMALEEGVKRVVIDSVTVLIQTFGLEKARELLTTTLLRELKRMGVTTLLISEKPRSYTESEVSVEEYIADTVIELNYRLEYGKIVRYMRILKVRGISIPLSEITFTLRKDIVIDLAVPIVPHEIPAIDTSTIYKTGIKEIDDLIVGIPRGSQTLIVTEPGINSLDLILVPLIPLIARYGGPAIIRSYVRAPEEIKRVIIQSVKRLGLDTKRIFDEIIISALNPVSISLQEIAAENSRVDSTIKPRFLAIHSLNTLLELYPNINVYLGSHLNNVLLRRKYGITACYTFSGDIKAGNIPGIDIYDIVVSVKTTKTEGEYEVEVLRHPLFAFPKKTTISKNLFKAGGA